jgi:hypothetical protein
MKRAILAMAFGLASATFGFTPDTAATCECEIDNPCYQAVYALSYSFCGVYGTHKVPMACNGDHEAVKSACSCMTSRTFIEATESATQILPSDAKSDIKPITSTNDAHDQTNHPLATYATGGDTVYGSGLYSASADGNERGMGSSLLAADTVSGLQANSPTALFNHETKSVDPGTTIPFTSRTEGTLDDVFSTYIETNNPLSVVTSHSINSYTTSIAYRTSIKTYTKCPEHINDCSSGPGGRYTVTGTHAVSTVIYPVTEKAPPTSTDYRYTTETDWSTEIYVVTNCPLSVDGCPYGSSTSTVYPVSTTVYRVPESHPAGPSDHSSLIRSTIYTTETVYSTEVQTISEDFHCDCVYDPSTTWASLSNPVPTTSTDESFEYPTNVVTGRFEASDKPYYPAWPEKPYAALAGFARSQPSAVIPNQRPAGTAHDAEVTAGTSHLNARIVVAATGILVALLL